MYQNFLHIHVAFSSLFVIVALFLSINALISLQRKRPYTRFNRRIEIIFLLLLYISFFQGITLFFFLKEHTSELTSYTAALENATSRFWAVEHSAVMIFALILAQIGRFFTSQKISDTRKHQYTAFYFGTATLVTLSSLGLFAADKMFSS
jgi:formate hydrogenlyase subunit 3/multisubunit Na+/H+ antiporter MnhD subunit